MHENQPPPAGEDSSPKDTLPLPDPRSTPKRRQFGPYETEAVIGRGGMGVVYKARHRDLKRTVALKVLSAGEDASDDAITRFHREAEAVAKLGHHPNIVPVYDIGQQERLHYFAMHFVEGRSLEDLILSEALTPRMAADVACKIAMALHHAHTHGVLHRDVKPANILIGPNDEPQLTDFGLARDVESESRLTQSGVTLGTPLYMPPEQADGRVNDIDARSDVYSLGATLYEMLTFTPPFKSGPIISILHDILLSDPIPPRRRNPDIDRDLETICLTCMEKDPARRYSDAAALAADLHSYLAGESILAKPPTSLTRMGRWVRRQRTAFLAGGLALIPAAILTCVLLATMGEDPITPPPLVMPMPVAKEGPSAQDRHSADQKMEQGRSFVERARKSFVIGDAANRLDFFKSARDAFSEACELDPQRPLAFIEKGKVLFMLQRGTAALEAFDRAIELNPDLCDAYYGRIMVRHTRFIQSSIHGNKGGSKLRKLIESDLDCIERIGAQPVMVHTGRAMLLITDGKYKKAREELDKGLEADPAFADAYVARGSITLTESIEKGRGMNTQAMEEALEDLTKAVQLSGGNTQYRLYRVQLLMGLERYKEALSEADAVIASLPDKPYPYLIRSQIRSVLGDEKGAKADMKAADAQEFDSPELHVMAAGSLTTGVMLGRLGDLDRESVESAIRHLDAALERDPESTHIKSTRGILLMLVGRDKDATADLEAYLKEHSESKIAVVARLLLTQIKAGQGHRLDSPLIAYQAAQQHLASGRIEQAEAKYRLALKRFESELSKGDTVRDGFNHPIRLRCIVSLAALLVRLAATAQDAEKIRRLDEAVLLLNRAVELGFRDYKRIDEGTPFAYLRETARFPALRASWPKE